MPPRHLRHQVCGGRGDDNQVGAAAQLDMAHLGLVGQVEKVGVDLAPRQRRDRQRGDEFRARAGQNRGHLRAALAQAADQVQRLEGGDAAADDQEDAFGCQHGAFPFRFRSDPRDTRRAAAG